MTYQKHPGNGRGRVAGCDVRGDHVAVTSTANLTGDLIDRLVWTSVFGSSEELRTRHADAARHSDGGRNSDPHPS